MALALHFTLALCQDGAAASHLSNDLARCTTASNWVIGPYCYQNLFMTRERVSFQWFIVLEWALNGRASTE